jgi:hypothetical protein
MPEKDGTTGATGRPGAAEARLGGITPSKPVVVRPQTTTVQLARGSQTFSWTSGDIVLFQGDVSAYRSVRVCASVYTESGGLMLKILEVEDPATPVVILENEAEVSYQELRVCLDVPGRRLALRVWVDECPTGSVQATWGVWGRPGA